MAEALAIGQILGTIFVIFAGVAVAWSIASTPTVYLALTRVSSPMFMTMGKAALRELSTRAMSWGINAVAIAVVIGGWFATQSYEACKLEALRPDPHGGMPIVPDCIPDGFVAGSPAGYAFVAAGIGVLAASVFFGRRFLRSGKSDVITCRQR